MSRSVFCEHRHRTLWIHQHPLIFYHQPCWLLKNSGSPSGVSFSSLEIYPAFVVMTSATPEGGPTGLQIVTGIRIRVCVQIICFNYYYKVLNRSNYVYGIMNATRGVLVHEEKVKYVRLQTLP